MWSFWTAVLEGRDSDVWNLEWVLDHHPSWGRGSNGCWSLTCSGLWKPFPRLLSPANLELRRAGCERCCAELIWRPCRLRLVIMGRGKSALFLNKSVFYFSRYNSDSGPWEKNAGGREGRGFLSEKKASRGAQRRYHCSGDIPSRRALF